MNTTQVTGFRVGQTVDVGGAMFQIVSIDLNKFSSALFTLRSGDKTIQRFTGEFSAVAVPGMTTMVW